MQPSENGTWMNTQNQDCAGEFYTFQVKVGKKPTPKYLSIDKPTQQKLLGYLHTVFPKKKIQFIIATHFEPIVNDDNRYFVQEINL